MMSIASKSSNAAVHTKCPRVKSTNNFSLYNRLGVTYYAVDDPILINQAGFLFFF